MSTNEILYLGDSNEDLNAALTHNIRFILVGNSTVKSSSQIFFHSSSIDVLLNLLNSKDTKLSKDFKHLTIFLTIPFPIPLNFNSVSKFLASSLETPISFWVSKANITTEVNVKRTMFSVVKSTFKF